MNAIKNIFGWILFSIGLIVLFVLCIAAIIYGLILMIAILLAIIPFIIFLIPIGILMSGAALIDIA